MYDIYISFSPPWQSQGGLFVGTAKSGAILDFFKTCILYYILPILSISDIAHLNLKALPEEALMQSHAQLNIYGGMIGCLVYLV